MSVREGPHRRANRCIRNEKHLTYRRARSDDNDEVERILNSKSFKNEDEYNSWQWRIYRRIYLQEARKRGLI